jgi:hypothetical protein
MSSSVPNIGIILNNHTHPLFCTHVTRAGSPIEFENPFPVLHRTPVKKKTIPLVPWRCVPVFRIMRPLLPQLRLLPPNRARGGRRMAPHPEFAQMICQSQQNVLLRLLALPPSLPRVRLWLSLLLCSRRSRRLLRRPQRALLQQAAPRTRSDTWPRFLRPFIRQLLQPMGCRSDATRGTVAAK